MGVNTPCTYVEVGGEVADGFSLAGGEGIYLTERDKHTYLWWASFVPRGCECVLSFAPTSSGFDRSEVCLLP